MTVPSCEKDGDVGRCRGEGSEQGRAGLLGWRPRVESGGQGGRIRGVVLVGQTVALNAHCERTTLKKPFVKPRW